MVSRGTQTAGLLVFTSTWALRGLLESDRSPCSRDSWALTWTTCVSIFYSTLYIKCRNYINVVVLAKLLYKTSCLVLLCKPTRGAWATNLPWVWNKTVAWVVAYYMCSSLGDKMGLPWQPHRVCLCTKSPNFWSSCLIVNCNEVQLHIDVTSRKGICRRLMPWEWDRVNGYHPWRVILQTLHPSSAMDLIHHGIQIWTPKMYLKQTNMTK